MTNTITGLDGAHELLIKLVDQAPDDWAMRKKVAKVLFDARYYRDASQMIWSAPEIPPVGEDIVFSTRIVAKGQPTRAMRLMNTVIEKNLGRPEENLAMAKLFVKANMPLQAIRFYGAAVALDAKLIDDRFEVSLLNADIESLPWSDEIMGDQFPWDAPEMVDEEQEGKKKEDVHEELLNGLTQPVPIKSPLSETKRQTEKAEVAEQPVEEEAKPERELPTWTVQEGRATFDPNKKEEIESEEEEKVLSDADEIVVEDARASEVTDEQHEDAGAVVEPLESEPKEETVAIVESVEETVDSEELPKQETAFVELPKEESAEVAQPAFFKSYDDAHQHKNDAEEDSEVEEVIEAEEFDTLEEINLEPESGDEEAPFSKREEEVVENDDQSGGDDLADYVADAMAEYESSSEEEKKTSEGGVVGAFSSLVSRFCKKKSNSEDEVEDLVADEVISEKVESETAAVSESESQYEPFSQTGHDGAEEQAVALEEEQPAAEVEEVSSLPPAAPEEQAVSVPQVKEPAAKRSAEVKPTPLDRPGVHTSAQKLVTQSLVEEAPEEPKQLDGRTQLVALAPEDGSAYFEQLTAKYQNVSAGQTPSAVVVARDMANADYLKLIEQACSKDLDAFSKLLGLHRVMAANHCGDWGEDMNLLRKGYGDAVLATVVSKYSVSECREILNSVYQHPASAAAV